MKEFKDGKIQIKSERQTDGSCDKTETSSTTGSLTENSASEKKTCHKKLAKEFFVYTYVGNQRKKLKLIEMDSAEETSYESVLNFLPDRSDIDSACTKEGESDSICGDIDMEDTGNEDEKDKYLPDSGVETENSVVEVDILKEPIVYHRVDSDTDNEKNKSTSTEKIYSGFHSGEQMSLQSVSEFKNTSSPGTIELLSDTVKDISEDDKNSSDKEKPSVCQVPETDSTVPTVGATDKMTDNEIPTDPASEVQQVDSVNDTKGEDNVENNNDEASTEGAEEEKVTDAPKTSEEAALNGEVQNNEAAGNEQYPKTLDVPTECVESVEEGKVGSIGNDPKTGEEAALKGEVQNNCQETALKLSEAAGNEQYPKMLDVPTESVEKDKVVSAGDAPNTSQVNASDVPTKPDLSETSVAEVPTNLSDTHTVTEPTDKATAHEEYEAAFRPQSRK